MCLVKVRGEVEDDVIVPARVVERDHHHRETTLVESAPAVIERPPPIQRPSRSRRYSSNSSSTSSSSTRSSRSSISYGNHHGRHSYRASFHGSAHGGSSYDDRSRSGRSRSRERSYYRDGERSVSGAYERNGSAVRSSFRYVDPQPRGSRQEARQEIQRAEEHLARAAELQERDRRLRTITYHDNPRSSTASHRSHYSQHSRDASRRRSDVVVLQDERVRDRYSR
ncbi:hypothetical protein Dda_3201 [Drechslerella dactyloides]|uniref:Uncharacterized protein n=1 Tax=Drechslerella dactyloides TaxID=74499 RepID=A0AAD6J0W4_DREDA|nr:hypothetical protein Dda_3201 [Drechslerella dactyloides]